MPQEITLRSRMNPAGDVLFREMEGEGVLLNLKSGIYFGLNVLGARIWDLIGKHKNLDRVVETIAGEYEVERHRCEEDIIRLARDLHRNGLVEIKDG